MATIKDGERGEVARVDKNNRLAVRSVNTEDDKTATINADSYNINTGLVTLTTAGESGVLYVKNNETRDLFVRTIVAVLGPTTGGSATDTTQVRIYKNPTTGTLISGATAVDINSNRNFGSSKTLTVDAYKGAEGNTITNGSSHIESLISPGNRVSFPIDEVLTKGDSIAVSYEPNDSNTSMKTMTALICHLQNSNEA